MVVKPSVGIGDMPCVIGAPEGGEVMNGSVKGGDIGGVVGGLDDEGESVGRSV